MSRRSLRRFARGGQDRKFQRPRGNALLLAPLGQERGELGTGQRGMMLDPAHLRLLRQQIIEMAAPARRVLTDAIAARCRPIEYAFDPAFDSARGFGLLGSDLLQCLHDQPDIDGLDGRDPKTG
jgi:hypothetical protein